MHHIPNVVHGDTNDYFKILLLLFIILAVLIFLDPRDFEDAPHTTTVQTQEQQTQVNSISNSNLQDR